MKLSVFLFFAVVAVEGDSIYEKIISGKYDPGIKAKIQDAVHMLRWYPSDPYDKAKPYVYWPLGHENNNPGRAHRIATVALIGGEDSDAAVASHSAVKAMKEEKDGPAGTRYLLIQEKWYRVDEVTCKHPYSYIQIDTADPASKEIAILKINRGDPKMSPDMLPNGAPTYVDCDGVRTVWRKGKY